METKDISEKYQNNDDAVAEVDRLKFAKQILLFLFMLVIFVFLSSYCLVNYSSGNEQLMTIVSTILDITKTVVPSTVTLVLGFYFGRKDS